MEQRLDVTGYAKRWSLSPGDATPIAVSSRFSSYHVRLVRHLGAVRSATDWTDKTEVVCFEEPGLHKGTKREIALGSFFEAKYSLPDECTPVRVDFSCNISYLTRAMPLVEIGAGKKVFRVSLSEGGDVLVESSNVKGNSKLCLEPKRWYAISLCADAPDGTLTITANSAGKQEVSAAWDCSGMGSDETFGHLILGAHSDHATRLAGFNGKLTGPKLFCGFDSTDKSQRTLANWSFAGADQSKFTIEDRCGNVPPGTLNNAPKRMTPGPVWSGGQAYCDAVSFHGDDLGDCNWPSDFELTLPKELPSGVYSLILSRDASPNWDDRRSFDALPFFVRPPLERRANIALVMPTFSYRAYANATAFEDCDLQVFKLAHETVSISDYKTAKEFGLLSLYDTHSDGSGVHLASMRRPQMNIRADFVSPLQGFAHQLSADLEIVEWLARNGWDFDILTDEVLHEEGQGALDAYDLVLTGSHPEYISPEVFTAYDGYLRADGNLAYLGGNGFYWSVAVSKDDPELLEVRRAAGTRTWSRAPGESHHQLDGRPAGTWRHLDRPPNLLTGVGFSSVGFSGDGAHRIKPGVAAKLPKHLAAAVREIGDAPFGVAGLELDRYDVDLGSDPGLEVIASTHAMPDGYHPAIDEVNALDNLLPDPVTEMADLVHGDVVFGKRAQGGQLFSVGSIRWTSALNLPGDPHKVSLLTEAAIRDLLAGTSYKEQGEAA